MKKILFILLCLLLLNISSVTAGDDSVSIHFIDVKEGEATLIITPQKNTILIDTGNLITGYTVLSFLKKHSISSIDHLILTHPHPDHMGGAFLLLQAIEVKHVYDNAQNIAKEIYDQPLYRWYDTLVRKRKNYSPLFRGDTIDIDNVRLSIIWPPAASARLKGFNQRSLALFIRYNSFSLLHTGDITQSIENDLLNLKTLLNATVLKVGHHGHNDASSPAFLTAIMPRASIISIDKNNVNGYPSPETIKRLEELNSLVYQTALHGTISLVINEDGTFITQTEKEPYSIT
ncbi:ComEC/Rec2 family competence protein [Candidatus Omnitrophota bacterium]